MRGHPTLAKGDGRPLSPKKSRHCHRESGAGRGRTALAALDSVPGSCHRAGTKRIPSPRREDGKSTRRPSGRGKGEGPSHAGFALPPPQNPALSLRPTSCLHYSIRHSAVFDPPRHAPSPYQIWRKMRLITLRAASGLMYLNPLSADIEGSCIGPF